MEHPEDYAQHAHRIFTDNGYPPRCAVSGYYCEDAADCRKCRVPQTHALLAIKEQLASLKFQVEGAKDAMEAMIRK